MERLHTGCRWTEGPVWFGDGRYLLFSDIPNNKILRWTEETGIVSEYRYPSNNANGNARDNSGKLITCEHLTRRVTRTEFDGSVTVLADSFRNLKLNAPNDVAIHKDGAVWFTDPGYGILNNYDLLCIDFVGFQDAIISSQNPPNISEKLPACWGPRFSTVFLSAMSGHIPGSCK